MIPTTITHDHRFAIALARENVAQFAADMRRLSLLLGAIVDRLEGPATCPSTAAALADIARNWLLRDGQLGEALDALAHLERDFPVDQEVAE